MLSLINIFVIHCADQPLLHLTHFQKTENGGEKPKRRPPRIRGERPIIYKNSYRTTGLNLYRCILFNELLGDYFDSIIHFPELALPTFCDQNFNHFRPTINVPCAGAGVDYASRKKRRRASRNDCCRQAKRSPALRVPHYNEALSGHVGSFLVS